MGGQIIVPTVQHSGTHSILKVIGLERTKLYSNGFMKRGRPVVHGHLDHRTDKLLELAENNKAVIPLRHPAFVAVSWKKRGPKRWRTPTFLDQWVQMDRFTAFFFPWEDSPYEDLEEYLGKSVTRLDKPEGSIGDYPERKDLQTARNFLQDEWALVEQALNTKIGRKFYGNYYPIRGL